MQFTITITATALGALVIGLCVGRFHTGRTWNRVFEQHIRTHASNEAHSLIRALMLLHDGRNSDAAALLESQLDSVLITFVADGRLHPEHADDPGTRAVQVAHDYRASHPWQSARPEIQNAAQRLLSRVPNAP
jgi:hypothetical protein